VIDVVFAATSAEASTSALGGAGALAGTAGSTVVGTFAGSSVLPAACLRASFRVEAISLGTRAIVPSGSLTVTADDAGAASLGAASRQAPACRTSSRTSGATEAHGNDCAVAAAAPNSRVALSNEDMTRIVALRRMRGNSRAVGEIASKQSLRRSHGPA
jgi:hypothetical protein